MKYYIMAFICITMVSCGFLKTPSSNEPDLGLPKNKFVVNIEGDNLYKVLNLPITNDTIINLISQLGKHKYSTSRDEYFPYATTGMYLYYEFENGLSLYFNGPDAGSNEKQKVMTLIKEYPTGYRLEKINIENGVYKGTLPKGLLNSDDALRVEEKLGKHNEHFKSNNDQSSRVEYIYPNHGLDIRFSFYPDGVSVDSTIQLISITDSITEMKRFPTIYPQYKEETTF